MRSRIESCGKCPVVLIFFIALSEVLKGNAGNTITPREEKIVVEKNELFQKAMQICKSEFSISVYSY